MNGTGPLGVVVVGLGDVGASLITGVLASRAHLVHPFGSLVEGGGAGRTEGSGVSGLRDQAPFAELGDLVLGAFEVHDDDAYRAALRAGIVNRSLVDELRPELRKIRAMRGGGHGRRNLLAGNSSALLGEILARRRRGAGGARRAGARDGEAGAGAGGNPDRGRGFALYARRGARSASLGWAGSHGGDGSRLRLGRRGIRTVH